MCPKEHKEDGPIDAQSFSPDESPISDSEAQTYVHALPCVIVQYSISKIGSSDAASELEVCLRPGLDEVGTYSSMLSKMRTKSYKRRIGPAAVEPTSGKQMIEI